MELLQADRVAYESADFVKAPINKSYDEKVHALLFESLVKDEYYFRVKANYETYIQAQNNKLDFHKDLLNGEKIVEVQNSIDEIEYYKVMFDAIIHKLLSAGYYHTAQIIKVNNLTFKDNDMFIDYIKTIFTNEALKDNRLPENISFDFTDMVKQDGDFIRGHENRDSLVANPIKKYQGGMKLTRFFVSVAELFRAKDKDMEKAIGRFRIDPNDKVGVFISAYLPSFIKAGAIGRSCLSQGGVNEHSTFMTIGYPNVVLVHDADFAYRAWFAVDYKNKYYTLAHTYPRENFYLQLMVHSYLKTKGFSQVSGYFSFPEYMDMGAAQEFRTQSKEVSSWDNRDAYFNYSSSLFQNWDEPNEGRIAYVYSCSGCDKSSISSDFLDGGDYCESCGDDNDNHFNCHECGEYEHNDYSNYDEETEEYYCNHCYNHLMEERDQEEQSNEERPELTSVTIDYTLIKNAPRDQFYGMLPKIVDMGSSFISKQDISLLSTRYSKISNVREFEIYAALAEAGGVKWMDGSIPSQWNPKEKMRDVEYPFYISLIKEENTYQLYYRTQEQANGENKTKDEFYLRYFYLARNKIYGQLEQEVNFNILIKTYDKWFADLEGGVNAKYFANTFTLADATQLFEITNNRQTEFAFDDLETLRIVHFMLANLGYRTSTLQNILYTDFTETYKDKYFIIDNKGKVHIENRVDGIDKRIITLDMVNSLAPLQ
jgi:hypothetical protein